MTLQGALATFLAACQRWPGTPITLRQGARVIENRRRLRVRPLGKSAAGFQERMPYGLVVPDVP